MILIDPLSYSTPLIALTPLHLPKMTKRELHQIFSEGKWELH